MKLFALICLVAVAFADPLPTSKKLNSGGGTISTTINSGVNTAGNAKKSLGGTVGGLVDGVTTGLGKTVGGALDLVGGVLGGVLGGGKGGSQGPGQGGTGIDLSIGVGLQGLLNALGQGLTDIAGGAGDILEDIGKLSLSGAIDDVGNVVGSLGLAVGNILDAILPQGGNLVSDLFEGLTKLVICVLGSPGVVGTLTNDRRPGQNNPPGICGRDFGVNHGGKPYDGGYDSPQDLINFYGLDEIDAKLRAILDKATNGKGLDGLEGSAKLIAEWVLELSSLAKKRSSGNTDWSQDDILEIFRLLAQILGGIGESYQEGLGVEIAIQIILYLKENTKDTKEFKNFNWDKYLKKIKKNVEKAGNSSLNGAIKGSNNNSQQNNDNVSTAGNAKKTLGGTVGGLVDGVTTGVGKTVGGVLDLVGGVLGGVLGGGKGGGTGGGTGGSQGTGQGGTGIDLSIGVGLQGLLNALSQGLTNIAGGAGDILEDIGKLSLSGAVDDVGNVVGSLGLAVGNILDAILPQGGNLVSDLFEGLTKLVICVLGSPGVVGTLTNDRRPGQNNPPGICGRDFGVNHGGKPYDGGYDSPQDLINFYGLDEIDAKLRAILDKATNGKGVDGLEGSAKWIAKWVLELSSLANERSSGNADWSQDDILEIFRLLAQILGGIGESYQKGLGVKIAIQIILYLKENTKDTKEFENFNWDKYLKQIKKNVEKTGNSSLNGAIKGSNNNSQQNNGHTSQQNNQQNSNQQNSNQQNSGQQSGRGSSQQEESESQFEQFEQFENSEDLSQLSQSQLEQFEDFATSQFTESGSSGTDEFSDAQEENYELLSQIITNDGSDTSSQTGNKKASQSGSSSFQQYGSSGSSVSGSKGLKQSASEDLRSLVKSGGSSGSSGSEKKNPS